MTDYAYHLEVSLREELALSDGAVEWLMGLWNFIQLFDDIADGDLELTETTLGQIISQSLFELPQNKFYQKHIAVIVPIIGAAVWKWMAANKAESTGQASHQSYMWRAGFYDVVMIVACIEHGPSSDICFKALSLYGETAEQYLAEFPGGSNA